MYKISLVIPIYNVEEYIEECIYSVIDQLTPGVEVICVNDGTPDRSMNIVKAIVKSLPIETQVQFKLIDQENGGLSNARNTGIHNSAGSYIAFLDSDDRLQPEYFRTVMPYLEDNRLDILDFNLITSESKVIKSSNGDLDSAFNFMNWYMLARIINRDLFEKINFTENIQYEDLDLMPKLYIAAKNIVHVDKPLIYYRTNLESISRAINPTINTKNIKSLEFILDKYISLYEKSNNTYHAMIILQSYFMLIIHYCQRINLSTAIQYVDKYDHKIKRTIDYSSLPIDYRAINKKVLFFYLQPYTYLRLYNFYRTVDTIRSKLTN